MTSIMLHFWDASWPLIVDKCPCDVHFLEWLEQQKIAGAAIFHFGTGEHHVIARRFAETKSDNRLFGVTAQIAWVPKPSYTLTLRTPLYLVRN